MNIEISTPMDETVQEAHLRLESLCPKALYGLPCANCRTYYESPLAVGLLCRCGDRISAQTAVGCVSRAFSRS